MNWTLPRRPGIATHAAHGRPAVPVIAGALLVLALRVFLLFFGPGLVSGNGRIDATEIDVATAQPGRVAQIFVDEGDMVAAGQVVARMDLPALPSAADEAAARVQPASSAACWPGAPPRCS